MRVPPLLCALLLPVAVFGAPHKLIVEAGEFDREQTIVPVASAELKDCRLRAEGSSETIPYQAGRESGFILPKLRKGERAVFTIEPAPAAAAPRVQGTEAGGVLKMTSDGRPLLQYQAAPGAVPEGVSEQFRHGAHLHPVYTPAGRVVTGNHPPDHRWHRGIWFGWTDTDFEGRHPDFWNMGKEKDGKLTGEVRFSGFADHFSGPVRAGFVSLHRWIDHTSGAEKEVLQETWRVAVTPLPKVNVIDLASTQVLSTEVPLKLPKYYYGGLGLRGNAAWDPAEKVTMLTSEGLDRKSGDNSKARWVQMSGEVDGQPVGIAVLIHPDNFRFPQPLRLNPKNPQLCVAPSQEGDWAIEPGKAYVSKYRFVVTDGPADAAMLERAWNDYAHPPRVTME